MELKQGYKQTEVGVIPEEWEVCNLADLSLKITDGDHLTPRRESSGYYLLSARNVLNGRIDVRDVDYVGLAEYQRMKQRCGPEAGDILISCSGTIGRVAVVPQGFECVLVRSAALAKVNKSLANGAFLKFWLQGENAQSQISASVNQGAQPNLFLNQIERLKCPKPPLSEQLSIAKVLDDLDELLSELDQLIAKKRDIKQAAMQELLTGKRRLPGFEGEWEVKRLGEIGIWRGGMTPSMQNPSYWVNGDFPWISSGDIKSSQLQDTNQHVTSHAVKQAAAVVVPAKTLVLVTRSGILRKHLPVARIDKPMAINQDIKALIPHEGFCSEFLLHALTCAGNEILSSCMKSGTTVESVEFSWLKAFVLSIPLLEEQEAIASVLSDMDAEISALDAQRDRTRALKQAMMQELLTGRIRLV